MTVATRQQIAEYREAQAALAAVVEDELRTLWAAVEGRPYDTMRDVLVVEVPALIDRYGAVGQTVAAEWFEDLMRSTAHIPDLYAPEAWAASTRWALSPLYDAGDGNSAFRYLVGAASRHVLNHARHTISHSADRTRGVAYARVLGGSNPCAFCRVLASRGPVYASAATAGEGNEYHDKCGCTAVPMRGEWVPDLDSERGMTWEGDGLAGYDFEKLYREDYLPFAQSGSSMRDVVAQMREAVPGSR